MLNRGTKTLHMYFILNILPSEALVIELSIELNRDLRVQQWMFGY